jgi:hypothetical protein
MAIPINGRQVGFVPDVGIIAPPIDYGWREHCGAVHKWADRMSALGHKRIFCLSFLERGKAAAATCNAWSDLC